MEPPVVHTFFVAAGILAEVVALALVPAVLRRGKEPASAIAWILTLIWLPAVGATLFLLFGRDRVRLPAKRKRIADAAVRARVAAAIGGESASTSVLAGADELELSLFRVGAKLTHVAPRGGNLVEPYSIGDDCFDALGAAIDAAEHHVHAQYYLIRDDATGRWFRERLVAAARRGVEVRLLVDGFGCFGLPGGWGQLLRAAGGKFARFLPMGALLFQPINLRNHRKIVVVDGKVAFTGGFNVADEYRGTMVGLGTWRDLHLRIEGPSVRDLQSLFLQDWIYVTGERIDPAAYIPLDLTRRGDATVSIVGSGPDSNDQAIHRLFFAAITGARRTIEIATPYFVPDAPLVVALTVAAMRGVDVKIILPGRSNHAMTWHAGRSFYDVLLASGVAIYEYVPGIVHAKLMVVDGHVCLVGSANMDLRSFRLNFEVHALIHDATVAEKLEAAYAVDLAESRRIELDSWRTRARRLHVIEGASRLFSPLL